LLSNLSAKDRWYNFERMTEQRSEQPMITWGIIGCGNVTELKSGPAFNKVAQSTLHAVMRRDAAKAADYATSAIRCLSGTVMQNS
jgi:hypothetical protein